MTAYRTRYAPSPTGDMHLGHARTALATWVRARQKKGAIVMRMEDLDPPRVVAGSADRILEAHRWLGLDWDEGPIFQSDRNDLYQKHFVALIEDDEIYPCTCSRKEVASISSAPHGELGPVYPGTCRSAVSHPERNPAYRFKMPDRSPGFLDQIAGDIEPGDSNGDFVVRRADGLWSYHFAVVIDDAESGITEVIRASDLLSSTPRQIALYKALGFAIPAFAHVSVVVDENGKRLASRHRPTSVQQYRDAGWNAEQVIGMLAYSLGYLDSLRPARVQDVLASANGNGIEDRNLSFPAPGEMPQALQ